MKHHRLSRPWHIPIAVALGCVLLAYVCCCWVAAHYVTTWLFAKGGVAPPVLWRQVATSVAGLVFMAVGPTVIGLIRRPREQAAFQSVLSVLGRIAQGDFSARVAPDVADGGHPLSHFVDTINSMATELDRMERLRQEFISNVSHEIQSPLTAVGGFAQFLRDDDPGPETRGRYLDIIITETERLSRLSDTLLRLTALDGDRPALEAAPHRLDEQIRRVILAAEPLWTRRGLAVEAELASVRLCGDAALLDQVWFNLLHNAIKFTPPSGRIAVRLVAGDGLARVEVADTGIGIATEDQPRIFERFFKADRARNREEGGSGLGLALVRRIIDLHGGSVAVHSAPGHGATFTVCLPTEPVLATRPGRP